MAKVHKTEEEWRKTLTPQQYHVLREKGTELPGSGEFLHMNDDGGYACAACGNLLFKSNAKYDSTVPGLIGWPSFSEAATSESIELQDDLTLGMHRVEVLCKNCGSHLGHLFPDDSSPNGQHFCINSLSLDFNREQ